MPRDRVIMPVLCGWIDGVDRGNLTLKSHVGEITAIPSLLWIIAGADETIVVDTGPGDPDVVRAQLGRNVRHDDVLDNAFTRLGVDPARVGVLVMTHLHWDHAGALERFSIAEVIVHRRELQWAVAPAPAHHSLYELGEDARSAPRWTAALPRMHPVERDSELIPGVELVHLPGHSPGLMGLTVETPAGRYVIASDAVPTYENWRDRIPPGLYTDLDACYSTFDKLAWLRATILPGHDASVLERECYGASP